MRNDLHPYTVVFYVDGDYSVETFAEHVNARDMGEAFDKAKAKARRDGGTNSGRGLSAEQWRTATEIVTYHGHCGVARK